MIRKLLTLIVAIVLAVPSFAQYENSRQRSRFNHSDTERYYGLRLGLNSATLNSGLAELDMNARTGLALGFVYGIQLANSMPLWLEAGAFYSEKGGKTSISGYPGVDRITCRISYLEVPVVVKYSLDVADDLYVQPFLGGYMAFGIAGKTKIFTNDPKDRASGTSYSSLSVKDKPVYPGVNRFDGGLRLGCGIEYTMVYAEVGMEFGLVNIGRDDFESVRNQTLFVNIGVNF